jgi:murein DD-endopeptidase MepM/ murein hydrolase activator NlpD
MHNKKTSFAKAFTTVIKRLFRARNLIIISDHKVDHVPLSGIMQVLLLVGVVGFFSGVSYITGSYMSARNSIRDKEQKLASTTLEKTHINQEMDSLKRDMLKLGENGKQMSAYSKFIIEQYASDPLSSADNSRFSIAPSASTAENIFGQNNQKLMDRISYLEARMNEVRDENDHLVTAIRERTDKKINYFEDIIAMTGLDAGNLEHMATTEGGKRVSHDLSNVPALDNNHASNNAPRSTPVDNDPNADSDTTEDPNKKTPAQPHAANDSEGGPFIPINEANMSDFDHQLLANVDRMVLLHDIVEQLPLKQPVVDATITGPFGKRIDPMNRRWAIHPGIDMAGPAGAHIFCTSSGKVITAERRPAYGNMVDIDHGFGIVTRYAHMSKILVNEGDYVRTGQQIGVQGSTGRSTGPHVHYEVRINDRPVNPAKFLHAGEYVSEN